MPRTARTRALAALLIFLILTVAGESAPDAPLSKGPLASSRQAILVVAEGWDSPQAELTLFEREGPGDTWRPAAAAAPALLGRSGLGWGAGFDGEANPADPRKQEGDGRAPAGVFRIGTAFGYAAGDEAAFLKLPYIASREGWECVDDIHSAHYNRLARKFETARPDWNSSEQMVLPDHRYRWGALIEYNADPPRPGRGSCIFLHIWLDPSSPTSGCTALDESSLLQILRRLRPETNPVLIQLPRHEYERHRQAWGLP
ncbi:MAG: hypothetical protein HPY65_14415 [Syntrophaceae bacterium]|nr:hypothetical protein [Syntrophaceae bacterium]